MTTRHAVPPIEAPSFEAAVEAMRSRGMRVSAARRLLLERLFAADEPLAAEQLAAGVEGRTPPADLASVYRNLEALEEIGLVRHFHAGHGPGLYALTGAPEREYLVCERCHDRRAVEPGVLDDARRVIHEQVGWAASFTHFPIAGLCPACQAAGEDERR